jgi:hypothetical protein
MHGRGIVRVLKVHAPMWRQYDKAMSFTSIEMRLALRSDVNERFTAFRTIQRKLRIGHVCAQIVIAACEFRPLQR